MRLVGADFYNPVSQAIARLTNPLLAPLRRVIPGRGAFDSAALVLILLAEILAIVVLGLVQGVGVHPIAILLWAPLGIVSLFLKFYFFAILAMIVLSWIAPGNPSPVIYLLHQLTEPVMAPFRRMLPAMGGLSNSRQDLAGTGQRHYTLPTFNWTVRRRLHSYPVWVIQYSQPAPFPDRK